VSNRRRSRPLVGRQYRRPPRELRPALDVDPLEAAFDDLVSRLQVCCSGACIFPAMRWYMRLDLVAPSRLLVIPVCPDHFDRADREVCPDGHGEGACLSSPDDAHFTTSPEAVVHAILCAMGERHGVAVPEREDWHRLDVLRPLVPA
jgi:hypothetical protein